MTRLVFGFAALYLILGTASQAKAGIIYSQSPLANQQDRGAYSEFGNSNQQLADNFTLGGGATVQSALWYGSYDPRGHDKPQQRPIPRPLFF
jgi:hypothetical protein